MDARSVSTRVQVACRRSRVASAVTLLVAAVATTTLTARALAAQPAREAPSPRVVEAPSIGSEREDRARLRQALGTDSTSGMLLRALSTRLTLPTGGDSLRWVVLAPTVDVVHNSTLPFSLNDGDLWAGRGTNWRLAVGAAAAWGPLRLVVAPELTRSENREFQEVDTEQWHRPFIDWSILNRWASPWHQHPFPADEPVRFGEERLQRITLGQSSLWGEGRGVAAGISSENMWWGPGIRDALIMTNNAAGIPHAFVRTARPLRTPVGEFEGRWIVGVLSESDFYDYDDTNDTRSLSAAVVTWRPRWEPDLTVGVARAVFAAADGPGDALGRWLDVFQPADRPNARPWSDSSYTGGRDQLTSLFARWIFPTQGVEVYGEVGRAERPASLRDLLVDPNHTLGYVLGGQLARPFRAVGGHWRLQAEFTQLEQSPTYRYRPTHSWYSSRATPQGYTHEGQMIGAGIGPGSSHQWLAADVVAPAWSAGAFVGRWRRNTDAWFLVKFPQGTGWCEYDTTVYPGIRASHRGSAIGVIQVEAIAGTRLNAFNQNNSGCPAPAQGRHLVDVRNRTLRLSITPRLDW
jgi:hypothetical protein